MSALPALTEVSTLADGSCYGCWALPLSTDFHLPVPAYAPWQPKEVECVCARAPTLDTLSVVPSADYTDDVCRTGFSDGQIARIQSMWQLYRASSASVAGGASGSGTSQGQSSLDAPEAGRAAPATGSATPTAAPTAITLQLPSKAATPAPKAATKKTMAKPTKKPTNKPTKKATAKSSAKVRAVPTRRPTNRKQSQQRLFLPVG